MNLKELSGILGISQTTISRALNGYPEVNKNTRKRVEEAAKKYGYSPSSIARRLAGKNVEAVGVVYPVEGDLGSSPIFLEMIRTLSKRLAQEQIDVFITLASQEDEISVYERLVAGGRVDSFVVVATRRDDARIKWLKERKIPFVTHGRTQVESSYTWFDVDNRAGVNMAAKKLIELGHKRLCLINASEEFDFACERKLGLMDAIEQAGAGLPSPLVYQGLMDEASGAKCTEQALSSDHPPTAIICSSVLSAQGAARAIAARGLRLGQDISLIAWEDRVSKITVPELSVIDAPAGISGECIGELMLQVLRNKDAEMIAGELQQPSLVLNGSVARVNDAMVIPA